MKKLMLLVVLLIVQGCALPQAPKIGVQFPTLAQMQTNSPTCKYVLEELQTTCLKR